MVDYIEFRIHPSQNRYEACICHHNKIETVTSGVLEPLAMHSPKIKALCSKGSDETFRLQPPDNLNDTKWFTRSVLMRFVHIISSSDVLDKVKAMENEISQLEESRKFHASIYAKADDSCVAPDASKNELLRAMELRLTALRDELESAWHQAAGTEEFTAILKFCHHLGAVDLRNSLQKFIMLSQDNMSANVADVKHSESAEGNSHSETPAKDGQIERQSSSEGEESSCISEEDQPSVERSGPHTRSASPRRSAASPMRRIQIGRSGTRRSTALTIKSLSYIPAREKLDESESSDEEESEHTSKISENNACRMSVQDAISLFEGKQKAQTVDTQKTKSVVNAPVTSANKAVLRRWNAGMSENPNNIEGQETLNASELKPGSDLCASGLPPEAAEIAESSEIVSASAEIAESSEIVSASAEMSWQKEEELNLPQIDMMNAKPAERCRSEALNDDRDCPSNHRYKEKVNEKQLERKNPRSTAVKKTLRTLKNSPQSANPKDETSKPDVVKKLSSAKASPLPAARKSWPSTPSPRATAGAMPTIRRSKPTTPVPRSSQKLERSQPDPTSVKKSPSDTGKSVKNSIRKQQEEVIGASKHTKTKVKANEVTKKSSKAPLELKEPAKKPKPFLHKDSRTGTCVAKTKSSKENEMACIVIEQVHQQEDRGLTEVKVIADLETETQLKSPQKCEGTGSSNPVTSNNEVDFQSKHISAVVEDKSEDETNISPAAWTEIEEHEDEQIPSHSESLATEPQSVAIPHDESSDPGVIGWGNAENPPTMVYQKDVPKGLKKLLKFARKSKTDANTTRLSNMSVISRGEETRALSQKPTLHAKNYANKNALSSESHTKDSTTHGISAQATKGKLVPQSTSQKLPEGAKATRSFFSLSAFKGGKQNDPILH